MARSRMVLAGGSLVLTACVGQADATDGDLEGLLDPPAGTAQSLRKTHGDRSDDPSPARTELDVRRSLVVTEQPILARFSFERVMNQLAAQSRVRGFTGKQLFQQWWDTQNPTAESRFEGVHCDSHVDPTLGPVLNGFPYHCRPAPAEGAQVGCDPFGTSDCNYIPVGLFNRFDLAPADGSSCGEARIVFAKTTGQSNVRNRNLLIFEASLPNPAPRKGRLGCQPIVSFWAELSRIDDLEERAARLEQFYFDGLGRHVPAVVDIRHFGDNELGRGQVRTNQFVQDGLDERAWTLREFQLRMTSSQGRCGDRKRSLTFVPVANRINPYGRLFSATETHPKRQAFQYSFVEQVGSLGASEATALSMDIPSTFNSAQSEASGSTETNYLANFEDGGDFSERIAARIDQLGLKLEPVDIVARAQTQTCAGCHRLSNKADLGGGLHWPASLGFTHVTETAPETVDGVVRYRISEALTSTFLPARARVMSEFLQGRGHGRRDRHATH